MKALPQGNKTLSKEARTMLCLFLLNTVLLVALYFLLADPFPYILPIYFAIGSILVIAFLIYNRGFVGKGVTPDMLPDTMTIAEKTAFIEDSKRRIKRSRWMLTVIFPIILAIAIDIMYLYLWPMLQGGFS